MSAARYPTSRTHANTKRGAFAMRSAPRRWPRRSKKRFLDRQRQQDGGTHGTASLGNGRRVRHRKRDGAGVRREWRDGLRLRHRHDGSADGGEGDPRAADTGLRHLQAAGHRAHGPRRRRCVGGTRCVGEQRRHLGPDRPRRGDESGRLGEGHAGRSDRHLQRDEDGDSSSQEVERGRDHQHVLRGWQVRLCQSKPILHGEVGPDRVHQDALH